MSRSAILQHVRSLHQKKVREEERLFLVQGRKLVAELLASAFRIKAIHATEEAAAAIGDRRIHILPAHDLERMGTLETGNEVIAVVHMPIEGPSLALEVGILLLALDGITDPGNLGTLLRIADWFGVKGIACSPGSVDVFNPKCVQASMGSVFRVPVAYVDLSATIADQTANGVSVYRAEIQGRSVFDVELKRPALVVLGNESHGISSDVRAAGGEALAVPRYGGAESLNVAAAAAALCMEFSRRAVVR